MLKPNYRQKKIEESGLTEDEFLAKQFEIRGEILEPLETSWTGPLVVRLIPPRDWLPKGWEVDEKKLKFIREIHKLQAVRVDVEHVEVNKDVDDMCLERYKMFLKQYKEWVVANKDRLEEESYKYDQDYCSGRQKRGEDYRDNMLELPFYYPGQICRGKVVDLHLYQGAFVDIGGVYDGWVPIKNNDWYWIRQHIKVGMQVIIEILVKRDPYRFCFSIEMRFIDPNIDHLMYIRDCGRPPVPRKDPGIKDEDEPLLSNHPYVDKLWELHVAEQIVLDEEESNPEKYKGKFFEDMFEATKVDAAVEYSKAYHKKTSLPKMILKTSHKELDLDATRAERELRRNIEMDEYDLIHWRRSFEERKALLRDISCPLYRYDYWGEPKNSEKSKQERLNDSHKKSIVGKGNVWYEMSYDDVIKQKMEKDARSEGIVVKEAEEEEEDDVDYVDMEGLRDGDSDDDDEDDYDDEDFDYNILDDPNVSSSQPTVNGTESSRLSDEGIFEN
ncbi:hypothetical protein MKX01_022063 [Papaver californicum]|nr:hypothetical protein MKX01_022063 [Papaver californicum]